MNVVDYILLAVGAMVAVPILVVAAEVLPAMFHRRTSATRAEGSGRRGTLAVLVPAHNEELHIARPVNAVRGQLANGDRVLVVADNCSDRTAELARTAGAEVLERFHDTERGKGFALAAGMEILKSNPPEIVILLDADTLLDEGSLDALAENCIRTNAPVQAIYVLTPPLLPSTKDRISAFAFAFKNHVRGVGAEAWGLPCLLRGTGMAFPWAVLAKADLATGNIVEDMQLGIDLAIAGNSPRFCARARVSGGLPDKAAAATTQRTRWEHGHLQTILHNVPKLLGHGLAKGRIGLLGLALDVAVPPLTLLVMMWGMVTVLTAAIYWSGWASVWPLVVMLGAGSLLVLSILGGWAKFAQGILPLGTLVKIPFYILWKIPLYFGFIFKRQRAWVRTAR